jgi:hypothetical protein
MSEILVVARDELYGDAPMACPAICEIAAHYDAVWLAMTNREVCSIAEFPSNLRDVLRGEPYWHVRDIRTLVLGVAAAIGYRHHPAMKHPTQHLMERAGYQAPEPLRPRLKAVVSETIYDVLVAPWSRARERSLTPAEAGGVIKPLLDQGYRIGVLGAEGEPMPAGCEEHIGSRLTLLYGLPLLTVVGLMKASPCTVTADSAPNRLAHAADITERHILLETALTPPQWQGYPGVTAVKGSMNCWKPEPILDAISEKLRLRNPTSPYIRATP